MGRFIILYHRAPFGLAADFHPACIINAVHHPVRLDGVETAEGDAGWAQMPSVGPADPAVVEPLPSAGFRRRVLGGVMGVFGTLLVVGGLVGGVPPAVVAGCVFASGGTSAFLFGWRALQERRRVLRETLERRVLQLATRKGGSLTVTEVASDLNLSLTAAEGVLLRMDDGFRVTSDITDEGVLVFQFPEVQHRRLSG